MKVEENPSFVGSDENIQHRFLTIGIKISYWLVTYSCSGILFYNWIECLS
jgi:hypothetical protein